MGQDFFSDDLGHEKPHGLVGHLVFGEKSRRMRELGDNALQKVVQVEAMQCADGVDFGAWNEFLPMCDVGP